MPVHSAGILCYRQQMRELQVFLIHPGGPLWAHRDDGAWSIPKGLIEDGESPLVAAIREFHEETGFTVGDGYIELGQLRQPSKKIVHAWAVEADFDADALVSNQFEMEWPRGSGVLRHFPEADRGAWFPIARAHVKIASGQKDFLDRLHQALANRSVR